VPHKRMQKFGSSGPVQSLTPGTLQRDMLLNRHGAPTRPLPDFQAHIFPAEIGAPNSLRSLAERTPTSARELTDHYHGGHGRTEVGLALNAI
jgi:hypothetical protein